MKDLIKKLIEAIIKLFPLKNIIVLESLPDYSDNTMAVFNEMIKRGVNEKYKIVWTTHNDGVLPEGISAPNVYAVNMNSFKYKYFYSYFAKAIVVSNFFMQKRREEQYYLYLAHGAAFKKIKDNRYYIPEDCLGCDFNAYSENIGALDVRSLGATSDDVNIVPNGYPRNDELFDKIDLNDIFFGREFSKLIYWLPTFRQKEGKSYSSITIPFIYDNAEAINETAKENGVLICIKPHPAQNIENIKSLNLSNVIIVDNIFFDKCGVTNYQLLGNSDALLSDYSSVFYDYLLCDKPIGLCREDYEEYMENEGLVDEIISYLDCCETLYTCDELCDFIKDVANGLDNHKEERERIKTEIHKYTDNGASERCVDLILKRIETKE